MHMHTQTQAYYQMHDLQVFPPIQWILLIFMNYSAVGYDLMLTNQQYILRTVTLNRNACKTRLYIKSQLIETL